MSQWLSFLSMRCPTARMACLSMITFTFAEPMPRVYVSILPIHYRQGSNISFVRPVANCILYPTACTLFPPLTPTYTRGRSAIKATQSNQPQSKQLKFGNRNSHSYTG
ncbi:hypothetical protein GGS23DRAFT_361604 [Durotheca rogersii]|uniref:uncharacterized protein n=1 Tax=Durotheca rogersii TaxID=419775 RepID=UPI00221F64F2|nr:uncharacterized protein GGS23DRAFT_361604 [Durotheca rogersii]KAI5865945.1 hypothetical protein GGS23DRAFT_361604 [Durotheca rogersii]